MPLGIFKIENGRTTNSSSLVVCFNFALLFLFQKVVKSFIEMWIASRNIFILFGLVTSQHPSILQIAKSKNTAFCCRNAIFLSTTHEILNIRKSEWNERLENNEC